MLTSEPLPVEKQVRDPVSAGTVNGQGSFIFKAKKVGSDTILSQIINMVTNAQNSKPPISQLADKVSFVFVPTVMILSIITALAWYNFGPQPTLVHMIVAATSVLIIACPCALGLATSISTMIGVGKAANHPLAQALISYALAEKPSSDFVPDVSEFESLTGLGVEALHNGTRMLLGNEKLMRQYGVNVKEVEQRATGWAQDANTVVYFSIDDNVVALLEY